MSVVRRRGRRLGLRLQLLSALLPLATGPSPVANGHPTGRTRHAQMNSSDKPLFDAMHYKATTLTQWQAAAAAWHRWGPTLGRLTAVTASRPLQTQHQSQQPWLWELRPEEWLLALRRPAPKRQQRRRVVTPAAEPLSLFDTAPFAAPREPVTPVGVR